MGDDSCDIRTTYKRKTNNNLKLNLDFGADKQTCSQRINIPSTLNWLSVLNYLTSRITKLCSSIDDNVMVESFSK